MQHRPTWDDRGRLVLYVRNLLPADTRRQVEFVLEPSDLWESTSSKKADLSV